VLCALRRVEGAHTLWVARVAPLDGKKYLSAVSLDASSRLFYPGATCVDECCAVYHQLALVSLLFLLLVSLVLKKYNLVLFIPGISTSVLVLFILVFVLSSFLKVLFIFNLIFNSNFSYIIICIFDSYYFIFFFFLNSFIKVL
jgi:hypothetical protein